jgi:hypothetical protein
MLRCCLALVGLATFAPVAEAIYAPSYDSPDTAHKHGHKHRHNGNAGEDNQHCWEEDVYTFCVAGIDDEISADKRKDKFQKSVARCFPLLKGYRQCQVSNADVSRLLQDSISTSSFASSDAGMYQHKKTDLIYQCYDCVRNAVIANKKAVASNFDLRKPLPVPCPFTKPLKSTPATKRALCEEKCAVELGWKWEKSPFSHACKTQAIDICDQVQVISKNDKFQKKPTKNDTDWGAWNGTSYYQGTSTALLTDGNKRSWFTAWPGQRFPLWAEKADACRCLKQCKSVFPSCTLALNTLVSKAETTIFKRHSHICCQAGADLELQFSVISKARSVIWLILQYFTLHTKTLLFAASYTRRLSITSSTSRMGYAKCCPMLKSKEGANWMQAIRLPQLLLTTIISALRGRFLHLDRQSHPLLLLQSFRRLHRCPTRHHQATFPQARRLAQPLPLNHRQPIQLWACKMPQHY